jgi:hypothetical protein
MNNAELNKAEMITEPSPDYPGLMQFRGKSLFFAKVKSE